MTDVKEGTEFQGMTQEAIAYKYGQGVADEVAAKQAAADQADAEPKTESKKTKKVQTQDQTQVDPQAI